MAKSKGVVLGAGHVNHVGPAGAIIGNREGYSPGTPQNTDSTVLPQYREGGINTAPNPRGTPLQSQLGNPNEFSRVAEGTGRYGKVISENGQDHNDPASNGSGVIFDGTEHYERASRHRPRPPSTHPCRATPRSSTLASSRPRMPRTWDAALSI
jgi:hypothetical protein